MDHVDRESELNETFVNKARMAALAEESAMDEVHEEAKLPDFEELDGCCFLA